MRAYTELLVKTCHAAAPTPSGAWPPSSPTGATRRSTRLRWRVREDKERESRDGFDGTWVAHPDLVPVASRYSTPSWVSVPTRLAAARRGPGQRRRLLAFGVPGGTSPKPACATTSASPSSTSKPGSMARRRRNQQPDGGVATAEIARSQIWQLAHKGLHPGTTEPAPLTATSSGATRQEELEKIVEAIGGDALTPWGASRRRSASSKQVALAADFAEFLTLPAYDTWSAEPWTPPGRPTGCCGWRVGRGRSPPRGPGRASPPYASRLA